MTDRPSFGLRPFLPQDAAMLAAILRASIEGLTSDDYSPAQQDVWAATADDEAAWAKRLGSGLTLIATREHDPVGFIALAGTEHIDLLYVHPSAAGQGVATTLLAAIEKLAGARGTIKLTVEASDTAEPFFRKHGFVAKQRNTVSLGGEWLANTSMDKTLTPEGDRR